MLSQSDLRIGDQTGTANSKRGRKEDEKRTIGLTFIKFQYFGNSGCHYKANEYIEKQISYYLIRYI